MLLAGSLPLLLWAAADPVPALRYAAPALPLLAALASFALGRGAWRWPAVALALWWGAGMVVLHGGEHPRVAASRWLWALPAGTALANETAWDETLPVPVRLTPGGPVLWPDHAGHFTLIDADLLRGEGAELAGRLADVLDAADYYIASSGRQMRVLPRMAPRFATARRLYAHLASGALCYAPAYAADPPYPVPFLPVPDRWAQEPWRVYDHPSIRIWKKTPCFDRDRAAALLTSDDAPPPGAGESGSD
jgi:hypothetical protein